MNSEQNDRKEFELWIRIHYPKSDLQRSGYYYVNDTVSMCWDTWMSSKNAVEEKIKQRRTR